MFDPSGADLLPGLDRNKVEDALVQCFQAADPDNAGVLDVPAVMAAISGSSLNLTQKQVTALANAAVDADYGDVVYNKVIDVAWDLLVLVAREALVADKLSAL